MGFFSVLSDAVDSVSEKAGQAVKVIKENPGKAALGGVVGVGAVAAAPFTGGGSVVGGATLIASLTGAGVSAGVAGAAGAVVASKMSENKEKEKEKYREEGRKEAKAKYDLQVSKLKEQLIEELSDPIRREQFILTAFAVGICAANADGEICDREINEIDLLVSGIGSSSKLSSTVNVQIKSMTDNPPNLETVWALIVKNNFNDQEHLRIFSIVIDVTIAADEQTTEEEIEFSQAWNSLVEQEFLL